MRVPIFNKVVYELFQILKDDAVKVLHSICQQIWKTQQWPQDCNQFSFKSQRMFKPPHNCTHLTREQSNVQNSPSQTSAICVNHELPDVQAGFSKGRGTRDQIANIHWIIEKARMFQKNIYFCFIDIPKPLMCGSQQTGKFLKR